MINHLNCQHLKSCKGKTCKIPFLNTYGTGFLLGDGKTLVSAWHVVGQGLEAGLVFSYNAYGNLSEKEAKYKLQNMLKPEFILLNHKGQIVFDTRRHEEGSARMLSYGHPYNTIYHTRGEKNKKIFGEYEVAFKDYIKIKLPISVGTGLPLAKKKKEHEQYMAVGFNDDGYDLKMKTSCGREESFERLLKSLSHKQAIALRPLNYSDKEIMEMKIEESLKLFGYNEEEVAIQTSKYSLEVLKNSIKKILRVRKRNMRDMELISNNKSLLVFNAPIVRGQSGGPILNVKGEVVGITTNNFYDLYEKISKGGIGLRISN